MGPTQKQLAQMLGIDRTTVSKALSGSPGISAEMRDRVQTACRDLGYVANYHGRSLSTRKTNIISIARYGLWFHDVASMWLSNLEHKLRLRGFRIRLENLSEAGLALREGSCDGAIVFWPPPRIDLGFLQLDQSLPVIYIDCGTGDGASRYVTSDNTLGGALAVDHLTALGHTLICYFGRIPWAGTSVDRHTGYVSRMEELGLGCPSAFTIGLADWPTDPGGTLEGRPGLEAAISSGATAVVCSSDMCAIGVVRMLRLMGVRVPRDVSVVGYDNATACLIAEPSLTSVDQSIESAADMAVGRLIELMAGHDVPRTGLATPRLVERDSTGPAQ